MSDENTAKKSPVATTVSHWQVYPDWRPGRRYLTTFLTFGESPSFIQAAQAVQADLADAPVAVCPPATLHQTVLGAGWGEEFTDEQVQVIRQETLKAAAKISPFRLELASLEVDAEGVWFILKPLEPLVNLRRVMHRAITSALGRTAQGKPDDIYPHMTIAYCNTVSEAAPLYRAAEKHRQMNTDPVFVRSVDLIWLRRNPDYYDWDLIERMPFAAE